MDQVPLILIQTEQLAVDCAMRQSLRHPVVGLLLSLKLLRASDDAYEAATTSPYCVAPTAARHLPNSRTLASASPELDICGQRAQVAFIHVGKTGGSTLSDLLDMAIPGSFTGFHEIGTVSITTDLKDGGSYQELLQCGFTHYIVSTRDPLNRTVSAFNYGARSMIGGTASPASTHLYGTCFPEQPAGGALSAFAESLGADSECGALARACLFEPALDCAMHVPRGHAYIFRDTGLLDVLRQDASRRVWLVRQESFDEDVAGLWKWLCLPEDQWVDVGAIESDKTEYARKNDTWLSDEGARQLRGALSMDSYVYEVLEGLADNTRSSTATGLRKFSQTGEAGACVGACALPPEASVATERLDSLLFGIGGLLVGIVAGRLSSRGSLEGCARRRHRRFFYGDAAAVPVP